MYYHRQSDISFEHTLNNFNSVSHLHVKDFEQITLNW